MLKRLLIVGFLIFSSQSVLAEVTLSGTELAMAPTAKQSSEAAVSSKEPSLVRLSVAPSLAFINGVFGVGAATSITFYTANALFVGFETGFYRWSARSSTGFLSASMTSIPLMATILYRFSISDSPLHPYAGVAAGVSITFGSVTFGSSSGSGSALNFEGLLRPGLELEVTPTMALYFEPKFGLLDSNFLFLPQVGAAFSL